jgi:hypothetical protein
VIDQILQTELSQLIDSSKSGDAQAMPIILGQQKDRFDDAVAVFRDDLARLQAMVLYQIMSLFGRSLRLRQYAEELEPLLASWTRELLLKTRMLDLHQQMPEASPPAPSMSTSTDLDSLAIDLVSRDEPDANQLIGPLFKDEELESAYRTILISYLMRGVYAASAYQSCHLVTEMGTLPACVPEHSFDNFPVLSGGPRLPMSNRRVTYSQFADTWASQDIQPQGWHDEYALLLLVACKGVEILPNIQNGGSESSLAPLVLVT